MHCSVWCMDGYTGSMGHLGCCVQVSPEGWSGCLELVHLLTLHEDVSLPFTASCTRVYQFMLQICCQNLVEKNAFNVACLCAYVQMSMHVFIGVRHLEATRINLHAYACI